MAKYYGNSVKTGRMGGVVYRIRFGETIESQYQPSVLNPNTPGQVEARSKLKLLSQLSAVLAPAIAIMRVGAASARNLFMKVNYGILSYSDMVASVNIPAIQLTKSAVGFSPVTATRADSSINVSIQAGLQLNRVVYVLIAKGSDEKLRLAASTVVSTPGTTGGFPGSFYDIGGEVYVLAYGVRDNTEAARVVFGELISPTAEQIAKIIASRSLLETDITVTETRGTAVPA